MFSFFFTMRIHFGTIITLYKVEHKLLGNNKRSYDTDNKTQFSNTLTSRKKKLIYLTTIHFKPSMFSCGTVYNI